MKRSLGALIIGIVIGYGVQCEDSTGPPELAAVPSGAAVIAMDADLVLDSQGRVWRLTSTEWIPDIYPPIPNPPDSVAVWTIEAYVLLNGDGWAWNRDMQKWTFVGNIGVAR